MAAGGKYYNPDTDSMVVVPKEFITDDAGDGGRATVDWDSFNEAEAANRIAYDEEGNAFLKNVPHGVTPQDAAKVTGHADTPNFVYNGTPVIPLAGSDPQRPVDARNQLASIELAGQKLGIPNILDYIVQLPAGAATWSVGAPGSGQTVSGPAGPYAPAQLMHMVAQVNSQSSFIDDLGPMAVLAPFMLTAGAGMLPGLFAESGLSSITGIAPKVGGSMLGGAALGGVTGGAEGMLTGLATSGAGGAAAGAAGDIVKVASDISPIAGGVLEGAIKGGISGAASGDPLGGAAKGAIFGGVGEGAKQVADAGEGMLANLFGPADAVESPQGGMLGGKGDDFFQTSQPVMAGNFTPNPNAGPTTFEAMGLPISDPSMFEMTLAPTDFTGMVDFSRTGPGAETADLASVAEDKIPVDPTADDPSAPEHDIDSQEAQGYASIAKSVYEAYEALTGDQLKVPQYQTPAQEEGESDQEYQVRVVEDVTDYIDLPSLKGLGVDTSGFDAIAAEYDPGSPEYLSAILAEIDSLIEQIAGVDPSILLEGEDAGQLQERFRGRTSDEMMALQRALYARGALGNLSFSGVGTDPFTGATYDLGTGDKPTDVTTAAFQRGLEQLGREAGAAGTGREARDILLGDRETDLFGLNRAQAERRKREELMASIMLDPRRRREFEMMFGPQALQFLMQDTGMFDMLNPTITDIGVS